MQSPHVINYLRVMRGMRPIQHFASGGVAQPYGGGAWFPPPPIQPINGFGGQPVMPQYHMDPWNRQPIRRFAQGGVAGQNPFLFGAGIMPPPPVQPINDFSGGQGQGSMPPIMTDQPHPGQFQVQGAAPAFPFQGSPWNSGPLPQAPIPTGVPWTGPAGGPRTPPPAGFDPNIGPPPQGSQAWLMQQKFGGGPPIQGYAYGGVVKKKGKKMKKVSPQTGDFLPNDLPEHLDPRTLRGWSSNAGAGSV